MFPSTPTISGGKGSNPEKDMLFSGRESKGDF
jgi:hypothetical protein